MRATGAETTETPIHEIGHNFDNYRWSFETEALAKFFTYYYYSVTGRRMANAQDSRIFRGNEFREYMRDHARRGLGQINHNEALRQGIYSPYSMAYVLANIAGSIGWQPFTETFGHFHRLQANQLPTSDIGRLNLFMSLLRHHSGGRDVISMIPANARNIYQNFFGGTIQYVAIPAIPIRPTGVTITGNTAAIAVNGTLSLTANVTPTNASDRSVTWSSNNTAVATVDSQGRVIGRAAGTSNITARTNMANINGQHLTATTTVTVNVTQIRPTGVTITGNTAAIAVNGTLSLTANVTPTNASDRSVTWSSNNTAVATVSAAGWVTGRAAGTATITATTNMTNANGQRLTASTTVTVNAPQIRPTGVSISGNVGGNMNINEMRQLTANVTPTNASDRSVTWSSSNTNVAMVDSQGRVTARAAGTSNITARTNMPNVSGLHPTSTTTVTVNAQATPVQTSITMSLSASDVTVPFSGSTTVIVTAAVRDQFGNVMQNILPNLAVNPAYTGVSVNNTTRIVTIASTAAPGTATIRATHGTLSQTANLHLTRDALAAPANFRQTETTARQIRVEWNAVSGASSYNIRVQQNEPQHVVTHATNGAVTSFTIPNLIPDTLYIISVQAVGANNQTSAFSNAISVRTVAEFRASFSANGGSGVPPGAIAFTAGQSFLLPQPGALNRPGFIFQGWREHDAQGNPIGALRLPSTTLNVGARNIDLHAQWAADPTATVDVNVFLYGDILTDPTFTANSFFLDAPNIARAAAYSFNHTFNMNMNIQVATTDHTLGHFWLRSSKNDCFCSAVGDRPRMSHPEFLCPGLPANYTFAHCHHSNVTAILESLTAQASGRGLQTMFIAGNICGTWNNEHWTGVLGIANRIGGDLSVNTTSRHTVWIPSRIVQHEWSHNYGAVDNYGPFVGICTPRQACIMSLDFMADARELQRVWCDACTQVIRNNRRNHS